MKEKIIPMSDVEINQALHQIVFKSETKTLQFEIALSAIENLNPAEFLRESFKDKGLKYSLDQQIFVHYIEDVVNTLQNHEGKLEIPLRISDYYIELFYFAYQIKLQEMLLEYGAITEEEIVF